VLISTNPLVADVAQLDAVKDNTIYSEADDKSNGAGDHFFAGETNGGDLRRGLLAFDVAGTIPSGSTINSVSLQLYMSRTIAGGENVSIHRVLTDWGEGTSHAGGQEGSPDNATDGDATWRYTFYNENNPDSSPTWTSLGGDYSGSPSATTSVSGVGFYTWGSTTGMETDVQSWLDTPAGDFGWILVGNEGPNATAKRFDSRTFDNASRRPALTIDFTPPAVDGACCFDDGACLILAQTECTNQSGSYQGDGTDCMPNPCPQPGACCLGDGTCSDLLPAECTNQSGTFQGEGTTCATTDCIGACCLNDATCQSLTEAECLAQFGTFQGLGVNCTTNLCPFVLTPFIDPLPLPAVAQPVSGMAGGAADYEVAIREFDQQLHSELPATRVWGYDDGTGATYPGPTFETTSGQPITVTWTNDLRDAANNPRTDHYLTVDLCPHGAVNQAKTVVHLHGGHVPAAFDGYPEDTFLPLDSAVYEYPNNQQAASIWYHDHALGITRLNVYMGLAGFYLVRDAEEEALDLPVGEFEVPMVIQDRRFNSDGTWKYPEVWQDHFFGDVLLVNGKVWPFLNVKQGKYRFRVLNGSNSRTYTLSLSDGALFDQIGTDGGLLPAPVTLTELTISSGERADIVIDFESYPPGTELILTNSAPAPFPGQPGVGVIPEVMKFVVTADPGFTDALPPTLRTLEVLQEADAVEFRDFELRKSAEPCSGQAWYINGLGWDDITEFPVLGTTEVWRFINRSGNLHPMHMHLVFFQVLDRQPFELIDGDVVPIGDPIPPADNEAGWKDTVQVGPQEIVRVIARFEDYEGKFAYHCHILEHEDHEMMRQFQTVPAAPAIPAVSDWGVVILILTLLVTGTLVVARNRLSA
jgi:spore coat protein A